MFFFTTILLKWLMKTSVLMKTFCHVCYRGIVGLSLNRLINELPFVRDFTIKGVIPEIGTNDISHINVDPVNLAKKLLDSSKFVAAVDSVAEVVVCQVLPRVMVRL